MNVEKREITDLVHATYNPRKDLQPSDEEYKKIKRSIEQFGYVEPIIINSDNTIIGGHQRAKVLQDLGYDSVDVVVVDLDKPKEKALNVALNKISGDWDFDKLSYLLADIEKDMDVTITGFDTEDIQQMLDSLKTENEEAEDDDFDIEEALEEVKEPVTQPGDVWKLGRHYLMCGDSTNGEHVEKLMNGQKADLLLTDPPYNIAYEGKAGTIKNDDMDNSEFRKFLNDAFINSKSVMKNGAAFYIWHSDTEGYTFRGAVMDAGFKLRQTLIWKKQSITLGRQDYQWIHEPCLYGWNDGAAHAWYSDRKQSTVLCFDRPTKSELHPTMKPIPLFDYQIKNSSKEGDNILDLFGGSGTTLMACEQNGRNAYLMELDPRYADVIVKRYEDFTGEKAEKLEYAAIT